MPGQNTIERARDSIDDTQNGEFEVPRCEGKEELPPDPGIGWLRLRRTGSRGTSQNAATVSSVSRRVSGKPSAMATMSRHMPGSDDVSMAVHSQDSGVNDEAS